MTLSFDLETIALDDAIIVAPSDDTEAEDRRALSPFTGQAVVVACWNNDINEGACLTVGLAKADLPRGFVHVSCETEHDLLTKFWKICSRQRRFCTFNGLGFDVPFLLGRSVVLGVPVHRPLYMAKPWEDTHVDLCDRLKTGFRGKPSLDLVCRALGVPTPKSDITGATVGAAWTDGRRADVAAYCCRDTFATASVLNAYDAALGSRGMEARS